jgi:uncharacterized protein YqfB (UPF0267 family)
MQIWLWVSYWTSLAWKQMHLQTIMSFAWFTIDAKHDFNDKRKHTQRRFDNVIKKKRIKKRNLFKLFVKKDTKISVKNNCAHSNCATLQGADKPSPKSLYVQNFLIDIILIFCQNIFCHILVNAVTNLTIDHLCHLIPAGLEMNLSSFKIIFKTIFTVY